MKRQRGRNRNHNNKNNNNSNRSLDSNGPDVKIRGSANTIYDKYVNLARDAQSSGNRVKAENYRQHAEHYLRLVNEMEAAKQAAQAAREEQQAKHNAKANKKSDNDSEGSPSDHKSRRYPPQVGEKKEAKTDVKSDTGSSDGLEVVTPEGTKAKKAANGSVDEDKPKTTRRRKAPAKPDTEEAASDAAE